MAPWAGTPYALGKRNPVFAKSRLGGSAAAFLIVQDALFEATSAPTGDLTVAGLAYAPAFASVAVAQQQAIAVAGLAFLPTFAAPALAQVHALALSGLSFSPTIETVALAPTYSITLTGVTFSPTLTAPSLTQTHALAVDGAAFSPVLGSPSIEVVIGPPTAIDLVVDGPTFTTGFSAPRLEAPAVLGGGVRRRVPRAESPRSIDLDVSPMSIGASFGDTGVRQQHMIAVVGSRMSSEFAGTAVAQVWRRAVAVRVPGAGVPRAQLARITS